MIIKITSYDVHVRRSYFNRQNSQLFNQRIPYGQREIQYYSRVKNGLLPRIRTFREITFFMLCVTRIFKSYFECLRLVTLN
jgi:hypothetical protein